MKKFLLIFFLVFTVGLMNASAQTRTLRGKVVGEDKKPIAGAMVVIEASGNGAISDNNGSFEIPGVSGAVRLEISFIGYETKIVDVSAATTNVNVELSTSAIEMEDVVVTGYGNYTRKSFTGSAVNVNMGEVADMPSISLEGKLAGNVPGVTITSNQGGPGSVANIRIRGRGSINASTQPLYVIDGVPMTSGDGASFTANAGGNSLLASINPNDIASMTVIKDAAAASLYGSRAANGVIVITTKKGKAGKPVINAKTSWGWSERSINYRPSLSGPDRANLLALGWRNYAITTGRGEAEVQDYVSSRIETYASEPWSGWTDWNDLVYRKGFYQSYEVSMSGGNENNQYYASISYIDQDGIVGSQAYNRLTANLNMTSKKGRFTFTGDAKFSVNDQSGMWAATNVFAWSSPVVGAAWFDSPSQYPFRSLIRGLNSPKEVYTKESIYSNWFPQGSSANCLESLGKNDYNNKYNRTMLMGTATFNILKGFDVKEVFSYDLINENSYEWYEPTLYEDGYSGGSMNRYMQNNQKIISQTQLTYRNTIAEKHSVDALLSYEVEDNPVVYVNAWGSDYSQNKLREVKNAVYSYGNTGNYSTRLISYVAKAGYNYDGRYYIDGSFRRDGSSRLAPDKRWGNFWSVSGSWVASNEAFMQNDVVTLAKLRLSYGVNGTQPYNANGYMGMYQYGVGDYNDYKGLALTQLPNPDLTWEYNYATNIGIDLSFWNRMNITLDLYNRDSKGIVLSKPVSWTTGFMTTLQNLGSMNNKGIEVAIDGDVIANGNLNWNLGLNFAHNQNRLTGLDGDQQEMIGGSRIYAVGHPYYSFNMKEFAGVDPANGEPRYYSNKAIEWDSKGNVTKRRRDLVSYDGAEQVIVTDKHADPTLTGGFSSNLTWKNLDFSFTLTFALGAYVSDRINYQYATDDNLFQATVPVYYDIDDMWQNPGDVKRLPKFIYGRLSDTDSDVHLMSTDHLRLKNITIGYTLPKRWLNKVGIDRLRVYASAADFLTWKHKDTVVDPEMYGTISFEVPRSKTITFGLDFTF